MTESYLDLALIEFDKMLKAEKRLDKCKMKLRRYNSLLTTAERIEYIEYTNEMIDRME